MKQGSTSERIVKAIIPAILLTLSVGQIYAFTLFSSPIAKELGCKESLVQFTFSLSIFFLGMGAAFFGKTVEKNIRISTIAGTALFILGLLLSSFAVKAKSLLLLYAGYGFMVGIGTGIIYISPVKTLMLWFAKHKAIASAISIVSFGLGSTLCAALHSLLEERLAASEILLALALAYLFPMVLGTVLLRKPHGSEKINRSAEEEKFSYRELLSSGCFLRMWLFMFINIACGLSIIPLSKKLMEHSGYSAAAITLAVSACGIANGAGRLLFAWWSDRLQNRINILAILLSVSLGAVFFSFIPVFLAIAIVVVNACYGAGFSTIPAVLADTFGMKNISKIHGAILSAWGMAGLVGNLAALKVFESFGIGSLLALLAILYAANLMNVFSLKRKPSLPSN